MNIPQAELDLLLIVLNFLLVGGIKDLASWAHLTIEEHKTVLLAGVISAVLVAAATVYGNHEPLTFPSLLHWFVVYAGSVGIYKGLAQMQPTTTTTTTGGNPPTVQTVTGPTPSDTSKPTGSSGVIPTRLSEVRSMREAVDPSSHL